MKLAQRSKASKSKCSDSPVQKVAFYCNFLLFSFYYLLTFGDKIKSSLNIPISRIIILLFCQIIAIS